RNQAMTICCDVEPRSCGRSTYRQIVWPIKRGSVSVDLLRVQVQVSSRRERMKRSKRLALFIGVLVVLAQAPGPAFAEWFADLYAGSAFTQQHDVDTDTLGLRVTFQDVTFDTSFAVGGRGGYWFESGPLRSFGLDIGLGLDVSYFTPDVSKQTLTACGFGFCASGQFADFDLSVTTIGLDVLLRYPLMK